MYFVINWFFCFFPLFLVWPRTAKLSDEDLCDGLRIMILSEGRFWPATVGTTQLPDVYAIHMAKSRGNRPMILPRDDVLKDAVRALFRKNYGKNTFFYLPFPFFQILPVKVTCKEQLSLGTRVCVFWSKAYSCLFPGTVDDLDPKDPKNKAGTMVEVGLDDGDMRIVEFENVRMLPHRHHRICKHFH